MKQIEILYKGRQSFMPEDELEKREGQLDNDNEYTTWVEYWYKGELVHRSAQVNLKKGMFAGMEQGDFGG